MKRKLFLGLLAAAAVSFTACQKDEVLSEVPQDQPIEFGTYVGRGAETKAASIDNVSDLNKISFGVFAFYTGGNDWSESATPNFMFDQKVSIPNGGSAWEYSPLKYWPNNTGDQISFFAYAPWDADDKLTVSSNITPGTPKLYYSVDADVNEHIDVLYSKNDTKNMTKQSITGMIKFEFAHALSRIGFSAQILDDVVAEDKTGESDKTQTGKGFDYENTRVEIKEIEIKGGFVTGGVLSLNNPTTWEKSASKYDSFTIPASKLYNCTTNGSNTLINKTSLNVAGEKESGYLMVVPHYFDGSTTQNALQIRVLYTVTTFDDKLDGGQSVITNNITSDYFSFNFEQGKAYNFNLQLGLTSVKFDASVSEWKDGGDYAVNVPINFNN